MLSCLCLSWVWALRQSQPCLRLQALLPGVARRVGLFVVSLNNERHGWWAHTKARQRPDCGPAWLTESTIQTLINRLSSPTRPSLSFLRLLNPFLSGSFRFSVFMCCFSKSLFDVFTLFYFFILSRSFVVSTVLYFSVYSNGPFSVR